MNKAFKALATIGILANTAGVALTYHLRNSMPDARKLFFFFVAGVLVWSIAMLMFTKTKEETG